MLKKALSLGTVVIMMFLILATNDPAYGMGVPANGSPQQAGAVNWSRQSPYTTGTTNNWKVYLGQSGYGGNAVGAPAIGADGTIYVEVGTKINAVSPSGSLKWTYPASSGLVITSNLAIGSDGTVYFGAYDKNVYAINPDGTKKWSYLTGSGNALLYGLKIGPDGTVYVTSSDKRIYAIDSNGQVKWSFATGWAIDAEPAIGSDGTIYFGSMDGNLYALNQNGSYKWHKKVGVGGNIHTAVIAPDGTIIVFDSNTMYAYSTSGTLKWSFTDSPSWAFATPTIGSDGTIYFNACSDYGSQGLLYALNSNGTLKWKYSLGWNHTSPAIGSDGTIYTGSKEGVIYALNAEGTKKWGYQAGGQSDTSSPIISADGTLYFGTYSDGCLYALNPSFPYEITLDSKQYSLIVGDQHQTSASALFVNSTPLAVTGQAAYQSSDSSVASVDVAGKVTALSAGETTITVSYGGISAKATVNVALKTPPALTPDTSENTLGNPIDITFTDNADWRSAITGVTVDDTAITDSQYTISEGNINIATSVLTSAGSHTIAVLAAGYTDATVSQTMETQVKPPDIITDYMIYTYAGTGQVGNAAGGDLAVDNMLSYPYGIAVDNAGNVFLTDYSQRVFIIDKTTGILTIVAGVPGELGYSGDGGHAVDAKLSDPFSVAVDSAGNTYIADTYNHCIRMVEKTTGNISTIAGNGNQGYSGDGDLAVSAELNVPYGVAVDSDGNIYIADTANNRIRMVDKVSGNIRTIAGTDYQGYSGDGGLATDAELSEPLGVAIDSTGNIYIADSYNHCIRKIDKVTGLISTIAGTGSTGYYGDGGAATAAWLDRPTGVAVDDVGNVYIADSNNQCIRKVSQATGDISTIAGTGTAGYSGDGGSAKSAELNMPKGVAVDSAGNIYITEYYNHIVRVLSTEKKGKTPPEISVPENIQIGGDVYLYFTDDSDWRTAIGGITVDGIALTEGDYYIDEGYISISYRVTNTAGSHTIVVSAAGYSDANVLFTMVDKSKDAELISFDCPTEMIYGNSYPVTVTVKNTGESTWMPRSAETGTEWDWPGNTMVWYLGTDSAHPSRPNSSLPALFNWSVVASDNEVAPGETVTYTFTFTPNMNALGQYNINFRMLGLSASDQYNYFGATATKNIIVRMPEDKAQLISADYPEGMLLGEENTVTIRLKNTGETTWDYGDSSNYSSTIPTPGYVYDLKFGVNSGEYYPDNVHGFMVSKQRTKDIVAPGEEVTYTIKVTPSIAGEYTINSQMLGVNTFSDGARYLKYFEETAVLKFTVREAAANAELISFDCPSEMLSGNSYPVTVTVKNTGESTWVPRSVETGSEWDWPGNTMVWYLGTDSAHPSRPNSNPTAQFDWSVVASDNEVTPGEIVTYTYTFTPRMNAIGQADLNFRMLGLNTSDQYSFFGTTATKNIAVTMSTDKAQLISVNCPQTMVLGAENIITISLKNTGETTWDYGDSSNYSSTIPTPGNVYDLKFGVNSGEYYPDSLHGFMVSKQRTKNIVAPGEEVTYTIKVTPSIAGQYTINSQMLGVNTLSDGAKYLKYFGETAVLKFTVREAAANAELISFNCPSEMLSGNSYPVTVTVKNTGESTWVPRSVETGSEWDWPGNMMVWYMGTDSAHPSRPNSNPTAQFDWSMTANDDSVAPGENVTYTFTFTPRMNAIGQVELNFKMLGLSASDQYGYFGAIATKNVVIKDKNGPVIPIVYSLTVNNGTGSGNYNATATATVKATVPTGKYFGGWADETGNILTYNPTYSFIITRTMTLTAVVSDTPKIALPTVTLDTNVTYDIANPDYVKMNFLGTFIAPTGYQMVECGFVSVKNTPDNPGASLTLQTVGATIIKATTTNQAGQAYRQIKTTYGATFYVRGYVTYKNIATGENVTIYSTDVVKGVKTK